MGFTASRRFRAPAIHFLVSAVVAAIAAGLIFVLWFPPPFATVAGGLSLFALLISIDVVLGPALTAVVASPGKPLGELKRDIAVIALVQCAALGYGLYTLSLARPVALAFEVDRFRVVTAADIEPSSLQQAPAEFQSLPWTGPRLIAAVKPTDPAEQLRAIDLGLAGFDLSMVPQYWRPYDPHRGAALAAARPASMLVSRYPDAAARVASLASDAGVPAADLKFLPLMSRQASWVTLIASPDARIVGHLPLDGFF